MIPTPRYLSPLLLAQEFVRDDPWKLLVVCILLNRTSGTKQVKPMLADFFEAWPAPERFLEEPISNVKAVLKPLGFQNMRYDRLVHMSRDWLAGKRPPNDKLRGVGAYARDSYNIWIGGYLVLDVQDRELRRYVQWAQEEQLGRTDVRHDGPRGVQSGSQAPQRDADIAGAEGAAEEEQASHQADVQQPR